jgi:hypothetical protein
MQRQQPHALLRLHRSNVTDMSTMFANESAFDQLIGNWNTSNFPNMSRIFDDTSAFNHAIDNWNTSNVTNVAYVC